MRRPALPTLGLVALAACGGEDVDLRRVPAAGFFNPADVDFGPREVGVAHELPVRLTNGSADELRLVALTFEPRLDVFAVRRADGGSVRAETLARGQAVDLLVVFGPAAAETYQALLVLETEALQVELPIRGEGRVVAPARFEGPTALAFPEPVEVGARAVLSFGVTNRGERPGRITAAAPTGPFLVTAPGGGPLSGLPEVAPGERLGLELVFVPAAAGSAQGQVILRDSEGGAITLEASGQAVDAGRLDCTPTALDLGGVRRGQSSSGAVTCAVSGGAYTLADLAVTGGDGAFRVAASSAQPGGAIQALSVTVALDATGRAGPREGELVLTARHGAVTTVPLTGAVQPPEPASLSLQASLQWSAGVDLDLHLVQVGGAPFSPTGDCYWEAPTQDWGAAGDPDDDPYLDQDARRGPAQELINVGGDAAGTYELWVHYFGPTAGGSRPAAPFTLSWTLRGGAPGTTSHTLAGCGEIWLAGRAHLDPNDLRFEPLDQTSDAYKSYTFECGP